MAANPVIGSQLRLELARIAIEENRLQIEADAAARKARLDAEADARKSQVEKEAAERRNRLDAALAEQKAALEGAMAASKSDLEQRHHDMAETGAAHDLQSELVEKRTRKAYAPFVLSCVVTLGFFVILALLIFMKPYLERPEPPKIPPR